MKRRIRASLIALLISLPTFAQPDLGECEQETEEVVSNQIPRALKAWQNKNLRETERYLEKAVRMDPEYAHGLYLLGEFNFRKRDIRKAKFLWEKLYAVCPDYKPEIAYFLGAMKAEAGQYEEAIPMLEAYLTNMDRDIGFDKEAKATLEEAKFRKELLANPVDFQPRLVKGISTPADEYLATISPDQRAMYFTRRSAKVVRNSGPAMTKRMVEEFCRATRNGEDFEAGAPMPSPFNTSYNEGGPSITGDNTELYFTVCEDLDGYKNCDIYYTELDEFGYWITPRSVGDHINRRDSWESQASVTANGDYLYFTSDRKTGVGGLDIYRCKKLADGTWSDPELLPTTVNTPKDEKSPFIHSDSRTLYFTSNGHLGLGGFDIFYTRGAEGDSTWTPAKNIGYPINSKDDDLGLFVSLDGRTAYYASNQLGNQKGWDLYAFDLPEKARPDEVVLISGQLDKDEDQSFEGAEIKLKNLKTRELTRVDVDQETGSFARVIRKEEAEQLIVKVEKKGAAFSSKYIAFDPQLKEPVAEAKLQLSSLEVSKEYVLNDINFSSNSFELNTAARAVIDEFVLYMEDNPSLKADIQGHTDNVGDDGQNLALSKNRARAVYEYVIGQGIPASRLQWHGYGESRPVADNDTEEGRAKNRRTVFVVQSR